LKLKSRWKICASALKKSVCASSSRDLKISALNKKVQCLEYEIVVLQDEVQSRCENIAGNSIQWNAGKNHLNFKKGKSYSDELRGVYMRLLSLGVAVGKCISNKAFRNKFEEFRKDLFSKHIPIFKDLSESE